MKCTQKINQFNFVYYLPDEVAFGIITDFLPCLFERIHQNTPPLLQESTFFDLLSLPALYPLFLGIPQPDIRPISVIKSIRYPHSKSASVS